MDNPSQNGLEVINMEMINTCIYMWYEERELDLPCSQREEDDVVEASIVDAT